MLAIGRHFYKDIVIPDRDMQRWNNTQKEADVIGVIGEYVVAKYLKIPFDTTINLNGDGGETDMFLGEWSIQVKSSKYSSARLVFNNKEEINALIYILVICDTETKNTNVIGYISKNDVLKHIYEENLGHGVRYCIDQNKLKCISNLSFYHSEYSYLKCSNNENR
jgi:hypothetical protein